MGHEEVVLSLQAMAVNGNLSTVREVSVCVLHSLVHPPPSKMTLPFPRLPVCARLVSGPVGP